MNRERKNRGTTFLLAGVLAVLAAGTAMAAETRTKIEEINLDIHSTIESGSSSGDVYITGGDGTYRVGSTEILNEDEDWIGGMRPRVSVDLYANSGYYFSSSSKGIIHLTGDDASVVTVRREDKNETMVVTLKLDKLENGDLTVTGASWDESSGTAMWDENNNAKNYQVKLYRDGSSVTSTRSTSENYYEFGRDITRKGDYYFEVRAVGSGSEKGDWESSDTWYVSAREADDFDGYRSDGPGGWSDYYSRGGPGVTGGYYGGGGPGVSGGYYGEGGPGVAGSGSRGPGVTTGGGNHWCKDQYGWWYQYADNTYPRSCWQCIDGLWYCFNGSGYIRYGWINWENRWYYCGSDGALCANTRTPDGYYVGGDGVWIP